MKTHLRTIALLVPLLALPLIGLAAHTDISQEKIEQFLEGVPGNSFYILPVKDLADGLAATPSDWVIVDIRPPALYANGHIAGSMNIPFPTLVPGMEKIPKGKKVAVVCSLDTNSAFAVALLHMWGFDAWIVDGGVPGWVKAGMPLER